MDGLRYEAHPFISDLIKLLSASLSISQPPYRQTQPC
jgi:hypothetical protein